MELAFDKRKLLLPGVHDASMGVVEATFGPHQQSDVGGFLTMAETIKAPWTPEQVTALNEFQESEFVHPFTCGGNNRDEKHLDGEGVLVATIYGWVCPFCDYEQDWAHEFMTRPVRLPWGNLRACSEPEFK
jgi:hypothetical protein